MKNDIPRLDFVHLTPKAFVLKAIWLLFPVVFTKHNRKVSTLVISLRAASPQYHKYIKYPCTNRWAICHPMNTFYWFAGPV